MYMEAPLNSLLRKLSNCENARKKGFPRNPFFRAFSQLLNLRFTAMVSYSFHVGITLKNWKFLIKVEEYRNLVKLSYQNTVAMETSKLVNKIRNTNVKRHQI